MGLVLSCQSPGVVLASIQCDHFTLVQRRVQVWCVGILVFWRVRPEADGREGQRNLAKLRESKAGGEIQCQDMPRRGGRITHSETPALESAVNAQKSIGVAGKGSLGNWEGLSEGMGGQLWHSGSSPHCLVA